MATTQTRSGDDRHHPFLEQLGPLAAQAEIFLYSVKIICGKQPLGQVHWSRLQRLVEEEPEIDALFPDCAHGAVPALGHCYALPLIVDDSIEAQPEIYMEAGDHETVLRISHAQFARLMENARHGRFSEKLPHS